MIHFLVKLRGCIFRGWNSRFSNFSYLWKGVSVGVKKMRCKDSENIFFDNIRCAKNYVFFSFSLWSAFRLYMYFCVYILKMTINKKIYLFLCIGISTKWCVIFLLLTFLVNSSVWPAFIFVLFTTLKTSPFFILGLTFFDCFFCWESEGIFREYVYGNFSLWIL